MSSTDFEFHNASDPAVALGRQYFLPVGKESMDVCTTQAQRDHMKAKEQFVTEWFAYHNNAVNSMDRDSDEQEPNDGSGGANDGGEGPDTESKKDKTQSESVTHGSNKPHIPQEKVQAFLSDLLAADFSTEKEFEAIYKKCRKKHHIVPPKGALLSAYHRLMLNNGLEKHAGFERFFVKKSVRSNSGVVVITVITSPGPFSCPHDCAYCPNEPGQPRSYLSTEPAVARANQNEFDPVKQIFDRACTLARQGHEIDKLEIIVLGGTWSNYPKDYQESFCRDIFYAASVFNQALARSRIDFDNRMLAKANPENSHDMPVMPMVALQLNPEFNPNLRPKKSLEEEQKINETAACKVIGLTLESRPDCINLEEVRRLRWLGCTRVQIGVQHTDDEILQRINRGHDLSHVVNAVSILKHNAFKVDIHLMPDLPFTTPEKDKEMFDFVLNTPHIQADHWKVYPCEVTPFSLIEKWYAEGVYVPYTERDPNLLIDLLVYVKSSVHPWIRLNRVVRDIPIESIIAGNTVTNLRQEIFKKLKDLGMACKCIRCREVRTFKGFSPDLVVKHRWYRSSDGDECFISIEGSGHRGFGGGAEKRGISHVKHTTDVADNAPLYGLLRLRFNDDPLSDKVAFEELKGCALIRELHTYGVVEAVRDKANQSDPNSKVQHFGIGKRLLVEAEKLAMDRGYTKIAVISGIGVRNYYFSRGYRLNHLYMVKTLDPNVRCDGDSGMASATDGLNAPSLPKGRTNGIVGLGLVACVSVMMFSLARRLNR